MQPKKYKNIVCYFMAFAFPLFLSVNLMAQADPLIEKVSQKIE